MSSIATIVKLLQEASDAYYNGGQLKMDDDTYDSLLDQLREKDPKHPYLSSIGAPPTGTTVVLPFPMPSLDKIKPGQDALTRFLSQRCDAGFLLSEKLDGLSALWVADKSTLYLRGDGLNGQDISHLVPLGIKGLVKVPGAVVRGELVVGRITVSTLARSWVNGVVHRKKPDPADVAKIRFVAYDLMSPSQSNRAAAMAWLRSNRFETAWTESLAQPTQEALIQALKERRSNSAYDTDGIVVALNVAPARSIGCSNPKDAVAFKMPLSEQTAITTVVAVHWGTSAQGYLIPKIEVEPIVINGATIQFCTAHNAKMVETAKLGPGAKVAIRRSGDVIPTIDRIITGAASAAFPPAGTWDWATDVHIRTNTASEDMIKAKLQHFLKTLDIPGSGPATAAVLVAGGITGPALLLQATEQRLCELLGPKTGTALYTNLRTALEKADEMRLMIASSSLPRGVGETKLKSLFTVEPDPAKWRVGCDAPAGWTTLSLQEFLKELPTYRAWRSKELASYPFPKKGVKVVAAGTVAATATSPQIICMTGFRDKALEAAATAAGHTVSATLTSKVTILLVPDGERKESEKTKAAAAKGIPILSVTEFKSKYLS
jgi:NAD-dependent DNA ligase